MKEQEILIDYLRKLESKLEEIAHSVNATPMAAQRPHPDLSKREQEIFDLIGKGGFIEHCRATRTKPSNHTFLPAPHQTEAQHNQ